MKEKALGEMCLSLTKYGQEREKKKEA